MSTNPLQLPYRARFTANAHIYTPSEGERNEVCASVERLRGLLPADIDPATHPTILYIVGNLFVADLVNLNDDAVTIEDTLRVYRQFEGQQVNIEHSRGTIVGYIVKAGLSEFGTDRIITEQEARETGQPFNVAIVAAIWKVANPDLIDYILESAIPGSPTKDDLSLSFEVGFDNYNIVTLPEGTSNLARATSLVTSASPAYDTLNKSLRINKGKGVKDGERIARVLAGTIVPLGAGIVATPAAAVKGVTPIMEPILSEEVAEVGAGLYKYSSTQVTFDPIVALPFVQYAQSIPDDHVYTDPNDPTLGRELETHCTIFYGIKGAESEPVANLLAGANPIRLRLGKTSVFEGGEDRPYDVLKVDVESEDLSRLHHLIKASVDNVSKWPSYSPHVTLCYLRKGVAAQYVGDNRFEGLEFVFNSVTFSPHTGDRVQIPLSSTQSAVQQVYSDIDDQDDIMASTPSRFIKLSAGWQEKIASAKATNVDITLSDGRKYTSVKVLDASTIELPEEISMAGVVISDLTPVVQTMTPGVGPQMDDAAVICPGKDDVYPTVTSDKQAQFDKNDAEKRAAQEAPLTGPDKTSASFIAAEAARVSTLATTEALTRLNAVDAAMTQNAQSLADTLKRFRSGVYTSSQPSSTLVPMKLDELKQSLASVKTIEELPTAVANMALFVEEISKASEAESKARKDAEQLAQNAQATLNEVKAQLEALTTKHNELLAAQAAEAAEAAFQSRMTTVEEVFAFDDDTRAELVEEIKACADDTSFEKWLSRAKKLFKHLTRESIAAAEAAAKAASAAKKDDKEEKKEDKMKEDCASAAQTAIASAANNVVDAPIINTVDAASNKSLAEQMQEAFANSISVGGVKVADLRKKQRSAKTA